MCLSVCYYIHYDNDLDVFREKITHSILDMDICMYRKSAKSQQMYMYDC